MVRIGNPFSELNNATRHPTMRLLLAVWIPNFLSVLNSLNFSKYLDSRVFRGQKTENREKICVELAKKVLENKYLLGFSNFGQWLKVQKLKGSK